MPSPSGLNDVKMKFLAEVWTLDSPLMYHDFEIRNHAGKLVPESSL